MRISLRFLEFPKGGLLTFSTLKSRSWERPSTVGRSPGLGAPRWNPKGRDRRRPAPCPFPQNSWNPRFLSLTESARQEPPPRRICHVYQLAQLHIDTTSPGKRCHLSLPAPMTRCRVEEPAKSGRQGCGLTGERPEIGSNELAILPALP